MGIPTFLVPYAFLLLPPRQHHPDGILVSNDGKIGSPKTVERVLTPKGCESDVEIIMGKGPGWGRWAYPRQPYSKFQEISPNFDTFYRCGTSEGLKSNRTPTDLNIQAKRACIISIIETRYERVSCGAFVRINSTHCLYKRVVVAVETV